MRILIFMMSVFAFAANARADVAVALDIPPGAYKLEFHKATVVEINKKFSGLELPEKIKDNPDWPESQFLIPEYYIAQYDLDQDGVNEIFILNGAAVFCGGRRGCPLSVYQTGTSILKILETQTLEPIYILADISAGYYKIFLMNNLWSWNKEKKKYLRARGI